MSPWDREQFNTDLDSAVHQLVTNASTAIPRFTALRSRYEATAPHSDDAPFDDHLPAHVRDFIIGFSASSASLHSNMTKGENKSDQFRSRICRAWSIDRETLDATFLPDESSQNFLQYLASFAETHTDFEQVTGALQSARTRRIDRTKDQREVDGFVFPRAASRTRSWQPIDIDGANHNMRQEQRNQQPQDPGPTSSSEDDSNNFINPTPRTSPGPSRKRPQRSSADVAPNNTKRRAISAPFSPEQARHASKPLPDWSLPDESLADESMVLCVEGETPGYAPRRPLLAGSHDDFVTTRKTLRSSQSGSNELPKDFGSLHRQPAVAAESSAQAARGSAIMNSTKPKDASPVVDVAPVPSPQDSPLAAQPVTGDQTTTASAASAASAAVNSDGKGKQPSVTSTDVPVELPDSLSPGGWVCDQVINNAMSLLSCHDGSIEVLDSIIPLDAPLEPSVTSARLVYSAFFSSSHWMLLQLDYEAKDVSFFNSTSTNSLCKAAKLHVFGSLLAHSRDPWIFIERASPQQTNEVDCGIFVLINLAYCLAGLSPPALGLDTTLWRVAISWLLRGEMPSFAQWRYQLEDGPSTSMDMANGTHKRSAYRSRQDRITLHTANDLMKILKVLTSKGAPRAGSLQTDVDNLESEIAAREKTLDGIQSWPTREKEIEEAIAAKIRELRSRLRKVKARCDHLQQMAKTTPKVCRYMEQIVEEMR